MKATKMIGTYPTLDGELTVTFLSVTDEPGEFTDFQTVSYTHVTLPTNREV